VAALAGSGTFFHLDVTAPTRFAVGKSLAETLDFAEAFCVAFLAILERFLMGLVIELNPVFHLDHVGTKSSAGERSKHKCGKEFLHIHSPFLRKFL